MADKLIKIPEGGIRGEIAVALREAAASEFRAIIQLVRRALMLRLGKQYVTIESVYPDRVVVDEENGRLSAYPYTLSDDNVVTLGAPSEVILEHKPVAMRESVGAFIEAADEKGTRWRIRVIQSGLSLNKTYYSDALLRESAPLFNGARVFVKSDEEHLKNKGKSFHNLLGSLSNASFIEGKTKDTGEIIADFDLLQSSGDVAAKMLEAHTRGMAGNLFGFSIDANGTAKMARGRRVAKTISKVNSVDLIIEPGAGGEIINLIEALNPEADADMALRQNMIEAVKKANKGSLPDGLDTTNDEDLQAAYREALAQNTTPKSEPAAAAGDDKPAAGNGVSQEDLNETVRMVEARSHLKVAVAESKLPDQAKKKLLGQFKAVTSFTEAQVDTAITAEREYLATFKESGHVLGLGDVSHIESGEQRSEKVTKMLDDFFDKGNRDVRSFRECYIEITGDRLVTGRARDCDFARLREAAGENFREAIDTTTFANVLGDSITRRMIRNYNAPNRYDAWKQTVNIVPVNDFRTQERTRYGGYGDLPSVAQKAPYPALSTPTDEKATYAVSKKGGIEDVSIEAIKNDDVGLIQRIPGKLSSAAQRTLSKFVFDFYVDNGLIYDGVNLFHASHGNLGTAALDAISLAAGRLAVLKQSELNSGARIGAPPVNLLVSVDQEEAAFDLFRRQTNNDGDFVETLGMNVIPVWYWTDPNDWVLTCDPNEVPTIEIGFLDGNEEPELFVQDAPNMGSLFTNDVINYKLRHIYGGTEEDYRGMYKGVVA